MTDTEPGRWDEAKDEISDAVTEAIGCLAPLLFICLVIAGFKLLFWLIDLIP
jgi:hypothetical protein